jgi:hypothetical protein
MNSSIPTVPENRDARLLTAMNLLQPPVRQTPSAYLPLLASSGLAVTALLLAYTMVVGPALRDRRPLERVPTTDFEISSHPDTSAEKKIKAQSAAPPVKEAVLVGTEASR